MIKWRPIIYAVVVVIVFLMLSVVAAVNYSGDEADNRAKQNVVYRRLNEIIESSQEFFSGWPLNLGEKEHNETELNKERWSDKMVEYIQISREKEGLIIIMKNSKGEFFNRIWPVLNEKDAE